VKKTVILGIAFVVVVLIVLVYTTMGNNRYKCEVCVVFQGRQACRVAAASTEAQAQRTATENACAEIASGVTDSMACDSRQPASVIWLTHK
jgi:hypothetical protein